MTSSQFQIRPFRPGTTDMSAITEIIALGNEHDALTLYMTRNIQQKWTSYRNRCGRFLRMLLANPGCVCCVAESTATQEIVGWAIWTRHGKSVKAKEWQTSNSGLLMAVERKLIAMEMGYYKHVSNADPTSDENHKKQLMPVLSEQWPEDIFPEFWELDGLYVHPKFYRLGIGRMLAQWGVDRGEEEETPVLVHSSPIGRKLYESVGFEVVKRMDGFDAYIPEFMEDLKVKGEAEASGCWAMCWQPNGTDYLQRAKKKMKEENIKDKEGKNGAYVVGVAAAISIT